MGNTTSRATLQSILVLCPVKVRLRVALAVLGLRQKDILARTSFSKQKVSNIVNGNREPMPADGRALALAVGVRFDVLFPNGIGPRASHKFTRGSEAARAAGRKGGAARWAGVEDL